MPINPRAEDYGGILEGYTSPKLYTPSERDKRVAAMFRDQFDTAHESRLYYEYEWELYRLFLKGEQTLTNRYTGEIIRLSPEDSRNLRSNNNVLRPTHRSYIGKITRDIPIARAIPASSDFEEQHGAQVANAWLEWWFQKEALECSFINACEYLSWAGNAFLGLEWDHNAGPKISYCDVCEYIGKKEEIGATCPTCQLQRQEELQIQAMEHRAQQVEGLGDVLQQLPPDVEPSPDMIPSDTDPKPPLQQLGPLPTDQEPPPLEEINEGQPCVRVIDTRWFFVEAGATSLAEAQWCCVRSILPVAEARRKYPRYADVLSPETDIYSDRTSEARHNSVDETDLSTEYYRDHVWEYEYHERPTPAYPDGRITTIINDIIVDERENLYWKYFERFPFFHFQGDHNCGEFWAEPWIRNAWHRQRELNNVEQQMREYVELVTKPKLLNPIGSRVAPGEWNASTGQNISYNPAVGAPQFVTPPPMPQYVDIRGQNLAASIREKGSITEQEAGSMGSDPNGRAMAIVEAEADQQLGPQSKRIREEWRCLQKCALILFQKFGNPESKWTIVGKDGLQTYSFEEMKLAEGWDLILEDDSGLPHNKALRQQSAMDLMNVGAFTDVQTGIPDMKAFQRVAGITLPMSGYDLEATERAAAAQIPYKLATGKPHLPQFEDDPKIFAEELGGWLRGPGRRPETDPALAAQVRQLWQFYTFWAQSQLLGQQPMPDTVNTLMQNAAGNVNGLPDSTGMGGSANGPGHMGSDIRASAGASVSSADQAAETSANPGAHEG